MTVKKPQDHKARTAHGTTDEGVFWIELDGQRVEFTAPTLQVATPRFFEEEGNEAVLQRKLLAKLLPDDADWVRDDWAAYGALTRAFGKHLEKELGAHLGE